MVDTDFGVVDVSGADVLADETVETGTTDGSDAPSPVVASKVLGSSVAVVSTAGTVVVGTSAPEAVVVGV